MERSQIEARLNDLDRESEKLVQEHNGGVRLKSVAATANEEAEAILIIDKVASQVKSILDRRFVAASCRRLKTRAASRTSL